MLNSIWHRNAILLIVSVIAVAASVVLLPTWGEDVHAEEMGGFEVSDSNGLIGEYADLGVAFSDINNSKSNDFTITALCDQDIAGPFMVNAGKNITLSSPVGEQPFKLTVTSAVRHFTVSGSLTLENIILDGNNAGGGIDVKAGGFLTMNNGAVIQNCNSTNGGGISSAGTLTMYSGSVITGCTATSYGGGVYSNGSVASFTMNDSKISYNNAARGAGVYNTGSGASFTMNNGSISGNTATQQGGGVYNISSASFTMNDSLISGNTAGSGGGVYNVSATFIMNGGKIFDNILTGGGGGGVYNSGNGASFTMNGGEISGNTSASWGGGVYNSGSVASFTMISGSINGNTAGSGGGVYNYNGASFTLISGSINGNKTAFGGGVYNYSTSTSITTTLTMSGGEIFGNTATSNGGGVYSDGSAASFTMNSGSISGNKTAYGGGVYSSGSFTMNDGSISGNTATSYGGGVYSSGSFTMNDGKIFDNIVTGSSGGGVCNSSDSASFTMNDGSINGNTATSGGGVYNNGTFTFENGEVSNNTATGNGGGVYNMGNSTLYIASLKMSGGQISDNTATGNGGGVYNYTNASLTMSGDAVISNNTANLGGGIYNTNRLYITGGTISGNTATGTGTMGSGGGIYTTNFANVTVEDGVVFTGNTAPTLRTKDIAASANIDKNGTADLTDYVNIGAVELDALVLNALVGPEKNAPAYNNFDINYVGDTYVVFINIEPNGGGTVAVTNSTDSTKDNTFTENGYVYLTSSASTITLSATPAEGYEFKQFSIGGFTDPTDVKVVKITGSATITAVFSLIVIPPHIITATADDGSTISPDGVAEVPDGEDLTFAFSAKPGYKITDVIVNGVPISPEELASGEYTFTDVDGDRTIEVVSEAVVEVGSGSDDTDAGGSDGTGTDSGGDSTDTDSSGGTGSGPTHGTGTGTGGSSPGTSTGSTGNGNENGSAGNSGDNTGTGGNDGSETDIGPSVTNDGEWSVLSMIFAVIAIFAGVIALVAGRDRFRTDDEERRSKTGITLRVLALIIGIVSVIVLFVTEYGSMAPVAVGTWTPLMFILLIATLILAMVSFRFDKADS